MSEISQNNNTNKDEIDLLDLFKRMGNTLSLWGRALGRAFLISVVFLLRRWLPLGLSLLLGIGASYLLKTTSESYYTTDLVVRNNINSKSGNVSYNSDMINFVNRLHTLCTQANKTALAEALSIKPELAKNIKDINAFWIIDKGNDGIPDAVDYSNSHNVYDTINVRMIDRFDIRVKTASAQELNLLQKGILSFIKKDSIFQQRNRLRLAQTNTLINRYTFDITQLDSLQKIKYFEETKNKMPYSSGQIVFLQDQKMQLFYGDIYSLYSSKQALESERDLYPDIVTVLSNFDLPSRPDNGTFFYSKKIIPLFLGITLIVLIFLANRRKLKEVYNKY
jgi:hypothetical protein